MQGLDILDCYARMHVNQYNVQWPLEVWPGTRSMDSTTRHRLDICIVNFLSVSSLVGWRFLFYSQHVYYFLLLLTGPGNSTYIKVPASHQSLTWSVVCHKDLSWPHSLCFLYGWSLKSDRQLQIDAARECRWHGFCWPSAATALETNISDCVEAATSWMW